MMGADAPSKKGGHERKGLTMSQPAAGITAEALAEKVGRDGKTVRAFLRKNFARSAEAKGARWTIDKATAAKVVAHYKALDAKAQTEAQAS
jgi:hypothetical protein